MNPHQLQSALAQRARMTQSNQAQGVRLGEVETYDASSGTARVRIQPEGYVTDYLPIVAMSVGQAWGIASGLNAGDQVVVAFEGGHPEGGVVLGGIFSSGQAPMVVPAGEQWLKHASGASIKLTNDGRITMTDARGTVLALTNDGNVTITGNVTVTGTVTATGEVTGNGKKLSTHIHSGVTTGGGNSGAPA